MIKKITHEQARVDVAILNKTNAKLRFVNEHEQRLNDYITQQEQLEIKYKNNEVIRSDSKKLVNENIRLHMRLELYKQLENLKVKGVHVNIKGKERQIDDYMAKRNSLRNQIKELEDEFI